MRSRPFSRSVFFIFFFVSGFCSLLYQVVWLRLAFGYFGIITPVLSVLLSIFMLGLGLGSWIGGRWIDPLIRGRRMTALHIYALAEFLTGLSAFFVPRSFAMGSRLLLGVGAMNSWKYLTGSAGVMAASLLPSCFLMGCTTPIIMAFIKKEDPSAETTFSFLYLANVLGAVAGALLTATVFIELWGFRRTAFLAVALNLTLGGIAWLMAERGKSWVAMKNVFPAVTIKTSSLPFSRSGLLGLLFLSGFTAMSFEVLWTREYTAVMGTTVYAFALILSLYLFATWTGSGLYRHHVSRDLCWPFAKVVTLLGVTSLFPIVLISSPEESQLALLSIIPCCFLFGYLLPGLIDVYSHGQSRAGGRAYAMNIAGCVMGPLLASYLFLPYLGVKISIGLLSTGLFVFGLVQLFKTRAPFAWESTVVFGLLSVLAWHGPTSFDERCADTLAPIVRRDYAATVVSCGSGMSKELMVNGIGITKITPLTTIMADLPMAFYPGKSRKALVICFGMGTTFRSLCSWGVPTTAVELVPSVKEAFGYYYADAQQVLQNPLGTVVIDDGRRFLKRTQDRYDIVTLDPPPPPEAAGSSLLYSKEFYALVKEHLTPGGILQQWWPGGERKILYATARTIAGSFPYVRVYKGIGGVGFHFLASDQPLTPPTVKQFIDRMPPAARADLQEWNPGWDLALLIPPILAEEIPIERLASRSSEQVTDDKPFNEYYFLRRARDVRQGTFYLVD